MKKIRFISVLLAVLSALSCISLFSTSAVEIKELTALEVVEVPNYVFGAGVSDIAYGIKVKASYADKTSETFTVTKEKAIEYATEEIPETGLRAAMIAYPANDNLGIIIIAQDYIGDFIDYQIGAMSSNDEYITADKKAYYPEDYECPEIFCKDYITYKDNADGTLTVVNHNIFPYELDTEKIVYPEITIPETIKGKTVTAIADYALLGYEHPSKVTVPDTVQSIGEYALGYCLDLNHFGENHEIPENVYSSRLAQKLAAADDGEKFIAEISLMETNPRIQGNRLKSKYFSDCTDYVYNEETMSATATITKAQIYSMKDIKTIGISLMYTKDDTNLSDEIHDFADFTNGGLIPAQLCFFEEESEMKAICSSLSKKYFNGRTDYTYDEYGMYINVPIEQLEKAASDDSVVYVDINTGRNIQYDLFKKLYNESDSFRTDIYITPFINGSPDDSEYKSYVRKYFAGCDYDIFMCENKKLLIIKNATKHSIMTAGASGDYVDYEIDVFSQPILNKYNCEIHGVSGSTAQKYAEENSLNFVATASQYPLGDVDLDGKISITDATLILKYNVEMITLTAEQKKLADFNADGVINVSDATDIQRAIVNQK